MTEEATGNSKGSLDLGGVEVTTPSGGKLMLRDAAEAEMYEGLRDRYIRDFSLSKQNDLVLLSVLLQQAVILERAQHTLNGMEPEVEDGQPTGKWVQREMSDTELDKALNRVIKASNQISEIEIKLGIDKKSREQSVDSVGEFIKTAKKAAHQYGVHISKRVKMYEALGMELRWRVRLLRNGDAEDRAYHNVSAEGIIDLLEQGLDKIAEQDRKYAKEVGKLFIGKL
jgi:hypothetical protein